MGRKRTKEKKEEVSRRFSKKKKACKGGELFELSGKSYSVMNIRGMRVAEVNYICDYLNANGKAEIVDQIMQIREELKSYNREASKKSRQKKAEELTVKAETQSAGVLVTQPKKYPSRQVKKLSEKVDSLKSKNDLLTKRVETLSNECRELSSVRYHFGPMSLFPAAPGQVYSSVVYPGLKK